ncbi:succinate dehydrogenase assembly factor 2 [Gonapodya sp. JEL0774]|nr:succinate dehydrogenase assembly factor 2 [Gonapodya sp. JEL0774]
MSVPSALTRVSASATSLVPTFFSAVPCSSAGPRCVGPAVARWSDWLPSPRTISGLTLIRADAATRAFSSSSSSFSSAPSAPAPARGSDPNLVRLSRADPGLLVPPIPISQGHPVDESDDTMRARLIYMCRKRGIKETDLLLSTFAKKYLAGFDRERLQEFDDLMEENDWDIFYWATGARPVPDDIAALKIFPILVEHCKNREKTIVRMPDEVGGLDVDGKVKV